MASFVEILGVDGLSYLDLTHTALFSILLLWLSQSFWTLAAGTAVLALRLFRRRPPSPPPLATDGPPARVAIVAPIYNEETDRVFAGFQAMWEDLRAQPQSERVDLIILSDTTDPDTWLAELECLAAPAPDGSRCRAHLLSAAPAQREAQDRQYRGLRHPLGWRLWLHDHARRR